MDNLINQNDDIFQVGLTGEKSLVFNEDGSKKVEWSKVEGKEPGQALTWYEVKIQTL